MIEFWYEFASTYSYPAAMRVERVAKAAGVSGALAAVPAGADFRRRRAGTIPRSTSTPAKGRYMWKDLPRICAAEGIPLEKPFKFPQNGLKAARLALVAGDRVADFTRAVYTANFAEQRNISDDATLSEIVTKLDMDATAMVTAANTPENKAALKAQTDEAIARDIFGAPWFFVGDEPFWGNDRLEDAIAWAKK